MLVFLATWFRNGVVRLADQRVFLTSEKLHFSYVYPILKSLSPFHFINVTEEHYHPLVEHFMIFQVFSCTCFRVGEQAGMICIVEMKYQALQTVTRAKVTGSQEQGREPGVPTPGSHAFLWVRCLNPERMAGDLWPAGCLEEPGASVS